MDACTTIGAEPLSETIHRLGDTLERLLGNVGDDAALEERVRNWPNWRAFANEKRHAADELITLIESLMSQLVMLIKAFNNLFCLINTLSSEFR